MAFNKGFAKVKELIDGSLIEYNDLEVIDRDMDFVGGAYLLIGDVPTMIQYEDSKKKYHLIFESAEGNGVQAQSTNKQVIIDLLKEIAKG